MRLNLQVETERRKQMNIRRMIQQSLDYIENNLKAQITVDELCNMAGYSRVHYCRLFQHYIGFTPSEYLIRRKLLHAVYDISKGNAKIDVALNYGFETYAGFYKAFKREFSCSPSEFIKAYRSEKPYKVNILQEEHIMISKTKVQKLLENWNLQNKAVSNVYNENTGRQNENAYSVGDDYIIKFTANLGSIKNNIRISKALAEAGLPAAEIIKTVSGTDYLQDGEIYFIMLKRIKGSPLKCDDIFADTSLAYTIGENIARLHRALKDFDEENYAAVNIYGKVVNALPKIKNGIDFSAKFIRDYEIGFGEIFDKLPKQIIHRDINPSNMIFDGGKFKGFIDFDLSEINIRIFDICYCATAILSECFNGSVDKAKWLEILNNLVDGYNSIEPLTEYEQQAIPYVIYSIQIICIAYFSHYDKFEALAKTNTAMLKWISNIFN